VIGDSSTLVALTSCTRILQHFVWTRDPADLYLTVWHRHGHGRMTVRLRRCSTTSAPRRSTGLGQCC